MKCSSTAWIIYDLVGAIGGGDGRRKPSLFRHFFLSLLLCLCVRKTNRAFAYWAEEEDTENNKKDRKPDPNSFALIIIHPLFLSVCSPLFQSADVYGRLPFSGAVAPLYHCSNNQQSFFFLGPRLSIWPLSWWWSHRLEGGWCGYKSGRTMGRRRARRGT